MTPRGKLVQAVDCMQQLFSEVAYGLERPLPDVWEVIPNWRSNLPAARAYAEKVMDYIVEGMPDFARRMDRFQSGNQA